MAKKTEVEKLDALIFIDTNIFLDFYRITKTDVSMEYLSKLISHKDVIITSSQVEMEFKKNRQKVIKEAVEAFQKTKSLNSSIPQMLEDTRAVNAMNAAKRRVAEQQIKIEKKIQEIFMDPDKHDLLYKTLNQLFKNPSPYNLNRTNKKRHSIRNLSRKRFVLGYPPRKGSDITIGDAVNWEWLIECAVQSKKHIIIVTRDHDYGLKYGSEPYLNDWLKQEFKERVGTKRQIILTDKLSRAFKLLKIEVTEAMVKVENDLIERPASVITQEMLKNLKRMFAKYESREPFDASQVYPEYTKDFIDDDRGRDNHDHDPH
jgi:predicted nucleic acid-binding protein